MNIYTKIRELLILWCVGLLEIYSFFQIILYEMLLHLTISYDVKMLYNWILRKDFEVYEKSFKTYDK